MSSIITILYTLLINTLAGFLTACLYIIAWKWDIIRYNLKKCRISPEKGSYFRFYYNLSRDLLCFLVGKSTSPLHTRSRDKQKLKKFKSSGGLLLTAHFHNWELMGQFLVNQGLNIIGCAKPLKNSFWNSVLNRARRRISLPVVTNNVIKSALSHLNSNGIFGVLWDQREDGSKHTAHYFEHKVSINPIPCFIFEKVNPPAFFLFLQPDNCIRIVRIAESRRKISTEQLANRYHRILKIIVTKYPEYWYGFAHNRFLLKQK